MIIPNPGDVVVLFCLFNSISLVFGTMEGRHLEVYNESMGTRGFDRSVSEWIAGRGVIILVKLVAVIN